jgi:membrane protease YdiL (CAAX protease family)
MALSDAVAPWGQRIAFATIAMCVFRLVWSCPRRWSRDRDIGFLALGAAFGLCAAFPQIPLPVVGCISVPFAMRSFPKIVVGPAPVRLVALGALFVAMAVAGIYLWWCTRTGLDFDYPFPPWYPVNPIALVVACVVAALFNAIWEEFLWRRWLPSLLGKSFPLWASTLGLSAAFGLAHLFATPNGWTGVGLTFAFGVAASFLVRLGKGRLYPVIIAHFAADVTMLLLLAGDQ